MSQQRTTLQLGLCTPLTLLFIALKLMGYITWSWWWVLSPLWIPAAIGLALVLIGFTIWAFAK